MFQRLGIIRNFMPRLKKWWCRKIICLTARRLNRDAAKCERYIQMQIRCWLQLMYRPLSVQFRRWKNGINKAKILFWLVVLPRCYGAMNKKKNLVSLQDLKIWLILVHVWCKRRALSGRSFRWLKKLPAKVLRLMSGHIPVIKLLKPIGSRVSVFLWCKQSALIRWACMSR